MAAAAAWVSSCGRSEPPEGARRLRYGDHPSQFADLWLPAGGGPVPVAVVLHGGFWLDRYGIELATPLARDLVDHGVAALAVEYRRVGDGGGWPLTGDDVGRAIDELSDADDRLDLGRVVAIGHSAGGQLAVHAAARPGRVPLTGVVAQAGVLDLVAASAERLGGGAVDQFLGGNPVDDPTVYAEASPVALTPIGVPIRLVHGTDDPLVPIDQSERFLATASERGDDIELDRIPGTGHLELIDPKHRAWATCRRHALDLLGR